MKTTVLSLLLLAGLVWPGLGCGAELAADNFNRADGGLGANWTTVTGFAAPQIVTNQVQPNAVGGAGSIALYTNATWPNDQYAQMKIVTLLTSTARVTTVVLRGTTAERTNYECYAGGPLGATTTLTIYRFNAGAATVGAGGTATFTVASGDTMKCTVVDSGANAVVKLYINDVETLSWTDTSRINSGSPGLVVFTNVGATTNVQVDDWAGGDFTGLCRSALMLLGVGGC